MFPEFSDLRRYTYREYRAFHTAADCGGFASDAFVYESADGLVTISADESTHEWGWRLLIPCKTCGYYEVRPDWYESGNSPLDAYECARAAWTLYHNGYDLTNFFEVEYV